MYLSQQIIVHLFNHFKTMFSGWALTRTFLCADAANGGALWLRDLGERGMGSPMGRG